MKKGTKGKKEWKGGWKEERKMEWKDGMDKGKDKMKLVKTEITEYKK